MKNIFYAVLPIYGALPIYMVRCPYMVSLFQVAEIVMGYTDLYGKPEIVPTNK